MKTNQYKPLKNENPDWKTLANRAPLSDLQRLFALSEFAPLLHADTLNQLKNTIKPDLAKHFVCQSEVPPDAPYYELIIDQQGCIPTRADSWHDLFNGLVWLQYPKTKQILNQWHVEDIAAHGLHPRTARRNKITHFDECGVILATCNSSIPDLLRQHRWHEAMYALRTQWRRSVLPLVFGHANLEMLMQPFTGLTGKWLAVEVEPDFFAASLQAQVDYIDDALARQLSQLGAVRLQQLSPLPLLGVPGWCEDNQQPEYYANQDYFRPKRQAKITPTGLPAISPSTK